MSTHKFDFSAKMWPDTILMMAPSPSFIINERAMAKNLKILKYVQDRSGATIILALKGFANFSFFPQINQVLKGTTASSLNEAYLGKHEFGGEVHYYAPAIADEIEWEEIYAIAKHITFNSLSEFHRWGYGIDDPDRNVAFGLRINPGYSEVEQDIYNPCVKGSRLGIPLHAMPEKLPEGVTGLHFHTLCEQNSDTLERTLEVLIRDWDKWLRQVSWVNFGGGHHITRSDYDVQRLIRIIRDFRERYDVEVILEPGEAIALGTGVLKTTILDIIENGDDMPIVILNTSATAHMPDVLEMPYRPLIDGGKEPGVQPYTYRLGGLTCLAGDVIGEYSFPRKLEYGDNLYFLDMAHYTMVKSNFFNGIPHPAIVKANPGRGEVDVVREFNYLDFRGRLGPIDPPSHKAQDNTPFHDPLH